jgi:hypothetical protein
MRHVTTDQAPSGTDRRTDEFDAWLDAFAIAEADDSLDRQLFAIRESLAYFRSL